MQITTIGLDIAKTTFHLFAVNKQGRLMQKKQLSRKQVLAYFAKLEPCTIAMEACGSANYWARELLSLGHDVKLIAPQYVKPFVKGNKNDYNDAEAIVEAAQRPSMRFVPIKTVEQQDIQNLHRQRERVKKERVALSNQIRGLLSEYGIVIKKGLASLQRDLKLILDNENNGLTARAKELFEELSEEFDWLNKRFSRCEKKIEIATKENEVCQRLDEVVGIGPVTASALYAAAGDGRNFVNGRHLSAWLGLVPRQHSSGGKPVLLGISKRGNAYLRTLLIHGARSVLQHSEKKTDRFSLWAQSVQARRGHNRACVAIANKLARIAWVIMARNERYRTVDNV